MIGFYQQTQETRRIFYRGYLIQSFYRGPGIERFCVEKRFPDSLLPRRVTHEVFESVFEAQAWVRENGKGF